MCPRLRIEDKHTYFNYDIRIAGNNRNESIPSPVDIFHTQIPTYPVQGTDEDDRIGRKIQVSSIHHEGFIMLPMSSDGVNGTEPNLWNRPTILDGWNGYMQDLMVRVGPDNYEFPAAKNMFSIPIRHMWVEFYDDEFKTGTTAEKAVYLQSWFKNLTIQIGSLVSDIPSIQTKMLRESTAYTGDFKIIKDTIYWLSPDKQIVHFNEELPYRRSLSFESSGADPSNAHLYSLWIGPTQPKYDYFNYGFGGWLNNTTLNPVQPYIVANVRANIKLNYLDL